MRIHFSNPIESEILDKAEDKNHGDFWNKPERWIPMPLPPIYHPMSVYTRPMFYSDSFDTVLSDNPGKFRVCQDAASRVKNIFLNHELCSGPDLLSNLLGVLLRFRRHPVAVNADIANFFYMIRVAPEDVAALRFLFFKDESMTEINSKIWSTYLGHLAHPRWPILRLSIMRT